MRIALAQIAPVLLNRSETLERVASCVDAAARQAVRLVCFGEALLPGYPVWLSRTDGARFDAPLQKELYARYVDQAVRIEDGHLQPLQELAFQHQIAIVLGLVEAPRERGGKSLFCSSVAIGPQGELAPIHRKLMPTYEERLVWAPGDGAGLHTHRLGEFTVGVLNCWENWLPLARACLQAQGEDLHIALWPGHPGLTKDLTPVMAREGRSYCLSVSGLLRASDIPADFPGRELIAPDPAELLMAGGSCAAAPDGSWLVAPVVGREALITMDLDHARVRAERQNFDPSGHYGRPDVFELRVDRRRPKGLVTEDP
jgi:nitrilase